MTLHQLTLIRLFSALVLWANTVTAGGMMNASRSGDLLTSDLLVLDLELFERNPRGFVEIRLNCLRVDANPAVGTLWVNLPVMQQLLLRCFRIACALTRSRPIPGLDSS